MILSKYTLSPVESLKLFLRLNVSKLKAIQNKCCRLFIVFLLENNIYHYLGTAQFLNLMLHKLYEYEFDLIIIL